MEPNFWLDLGTFGAGMMANAGRTPDNGNGRKGISREAMVGAALTGIIAVVMGLVTWAFNQSSAITALQVEMRLNWAAGARVDGRVEALSHEVEALRVKISSDESGQARQIVTNTETIRNMQEEIRRLRGVR